MTAETGYDLSDEVAPFRISGFLSLLCAILSGFSIIAMPMLAFALAAIIFGVIALRRCDADRPPVGATPARVGIILAVLFGAWGISRPLSKTAIIGGQAEQFAREYLKLVGTGEIPYAMELNKEYYNRYLDTMPLDQYYARDENTVQMKTEFENDGVIDTVMAIGPDAEWELAVPTRVFSRFGRNMAEVILSHHRDNAVTPTKIRIVMEYKVHPDDGSLEWHIDACVNFRNRIVADTIL